MTRSNWFPIVASLVCLAGTAVAAQDLDALSQSKVWQVRYCVPNEIKAASPEARAILERLADDDHAGVARQAFGIYSRMFVDLDKNLVRKAVDRGELDLVGFAGSGTFRSAPFWTGQLESTKEDALKARAVRALGLIGDAKVLPKLPDLDESKNAYLLAELAVAYRRLGDDAKYLATIDRLLGLPAGESVYYQTYAIDCLIQTHSARSRPAWERLDKELAAFPDLQPNWMYAHVVQQGRLR